MIGAGINTATIKLGKRSIENQLRTGNFKDTYFGKISNNKLNELNKIRGIENVARLENGKLVIPENVMKHFHERRVMNNKMDPREVSTMLEKAFFAPNSVAGRGNYPHIQSLIDMESHPMNVGFVGKHSSTGQTIVKGGYQKSQKGLEKAKLNGSLGGGAPLNQAFRAPVTEYNPVLQGVDNNIADSAQDVKPILSKMKPSRLAADSAEYNPNLDTASKRAIKDMNGRPGYEKKRVCTFLRIKICCTNI